MARLQRIRMSFVFLIGFFNSLLEKLDRSTRWVEGGCAFAMSEYERRITALLCLRLVRVHAGPGNSPRALCRDQALQIRHGRRQDWHCGRTLHEYHRDPDNHESCFV